jgi:hypothetical protein
VTFPRRATAHLSKQHHDADARASRRKRLLTPGFSLTRHLGAFGMLALAGVVVGGCLALRARLADLWVIPAYLLIANVVEYLMHRLLMHRPLWPRTLYRNHTLGHHRAFHHGSMEVESWREMDLVLMPWFSIAIFFATMAPVVFATARVFGAGAAGLLLLTAVLSFLLYEGMHALYHFPQPVLRRLGLDRNRIFTFLYRHHRHHHRLARMRWTNFNISLPLSDRLCGTLEGQETDD